jgi:hypothetical protein
MAILNGKNGTLYVAAAEATPLSHWRLVTRVRRRSYAANDTGGWKRRIAGPRDCAGRFELKASDDRHCPVAEGDAVALRLHVDRTGENYYDVPALVTRIAVEVDIGTRKIVSYHVRFAGNGPVVKHGVLANS